MINPIHFSIGSCCKPVAHRLRAGVAKGRTKPGPATSALTPARNAEPASRLKDKATPRLQGRDRAGARVLAARWRGGSPGGAALAWAR